MRAWEPPLGRSENPQIEPKQSNASPLTPTSLRIREQHCTSALLGRAQGGGFASRYGKPPLMFGFSAHTLGSNPAGSPDCNCAVVKPVMPGSFATFPAPWPESIIPLVSVSQSVSLRLPGVDPSTPIRPPVKEPSPPEFETAPVEYDVEIEAPFSPIKPPALLFRPPMLVTAPVA